MREQKHGHIVNISSIGVQTNPPRFSAYVASKAALDAWSNVVSSEVVGDGISFTNIHMPLVKTPMIAPTKIYDKFPTISPAQAAEMVVRAHGRPAARDQHGARHRRRAGPHPGAAHGVPGAAPGLPGVPGLGRRARRGQGRRARADQPAAAACWPASPRACTGRHPPGILGRRRRARVMYCPVRGGVP